MKIIFTFLISILIVASSSAQAVICFTTGEDQDAASCDHEYCSPNAPYRFSKGIYRVPYQIGVIVSVTNDHIKHCPRGAIDMSGDSGADEYNLVASADGWIRAISDSHTEQCTCKNGDNCDNNYVWIEHPNGEWTKYTHVKFHSASNLHDEDDWVTEGTIIGKEGTVGCSTGDHCHFEVAMPVDTNTLLFDQGGGWIDDDWAINLVPLFCNIPGNIMQSGESYFVVACGTCVASLPTLNTTYSAGTFKAFLDAGALSTDGDLTFEGASSGVIQGGSSVTLKEGFRAEELSYFQARVGDCSGAGLNKSVPVPEAMVEVDDDISIVPNPAYSSTKISLQLSHDSKVQIQLRDMTGRVLNEIISSQSLLAGSHDFEADLSKIPSGAYFFEVDVNGEHSMKKLIVQK